MTAKMQRLPYITGLVGMFLTITLCISCSHEQSSSSYVRERVEDLKSKPLPPTHPLEKPQESPRRDSPFLPNGNSIHL